MENTEEIDIGLKIKTINKVTIPKMMYTPGDGIEATEVE